MIRRGTAVLLTLILAAPSADVRAAGNGTIERSVTVGERPLSGATLARRLSPRLVGFARALAGRLSPRRGRPCRFPLRSVRLARRRVELAKGTETGMALAWERWLRHALVDRIPGG